jgi:hypothetical protein
MNDANIDNAILSLQKTKETGLTRLRQSHDSRDLASCDFFLFEYLKKELEGRNFRSENEMISTARAILKAISI